MYITAPNAQKHRPPRTKRSSPVPWVPPHVDISEGTFPIAGMDGGLVPDFYDARGCQPGYEVGVAGLPADVHVRVAYRILSGMACRPGSYPPGLWAGTRPGAVPPEAGALASLHLGFVELSLREQVGRGFRGGLFVLAPSLAYQGLLRGGGGLALGVPSDALRHDNERRADDRADGYSQEI